MNHKPCCDLNLVVADYYQYLYNFVFKQLKDEHIARDITQDVMLHLVKAHSKNQPVQNLKSWLFQIARNVIADHYKTLKKQDVELLQTDKEENLHIDELQSMEVDFIIPMIGLIPEPYSTVLHYSDIEKLSIKQVAQKMDISEANAKVRIQRARKKLYELFLHCCDITYDAKGRFVECEIKQHCSAMQDIFNQKEL